MNDLEWNGKRWVCRVDPTHEVVLSASPTTRFMIAEVGGEIRDAGLPPIQNSPGYCTCVQIRYENAPVCPGCGFKIGFAPGTGDCGCEFDREM